MFLCVRWPTEHCLCCFLSSGVLQKINKALSSFLGSCCSLSFHFSCPTFNRIHWLSSQTGWTEAGCLPVQCPGVNSTCVSPPSSTPPSLPIPPITITWTPLTVERWIHAMCLQDLLWNSGTIHTLKETRGSPLGHRSAAFRSVVGLTHWIPLSQSESPLHSFTPILGWRWEKSRLQITTRSFPKPFPTIWQSDTKSCVIMHLLYFISLSNQYYYKTFLMCCSTPMLQERNLIYCVY